METINKRHLLPCLQNSNLADQFKDEITVPKQYALHEIKITNDTSFEKILRILEYYMVKELPYEIYDYVLEHRPKILKFKKIIPEALLLLRYIVKTDNMMDICIKRGCLNSIKYLQSKGYKWSRKAALFSLGYDSKKESDSLRPNTRFEVFKYLHENGCEMSGRESVTAANNCDLDALKYMLKNDIPLPTFCSSALDSSHSSRLPEECSFQDRFECLKFLHKNGCKMNIDMMASRYAATSGNLDCLKYVVENGGAMDEYTALNAAQGGYLDCLKYLHEKGCPWDCYTCINAISGQFTSTPGKNLITPGHLDCLKYAIENGCLYDKKECIERAKNMNHAEILEYLENL